MRRSFVGALIVAGLVIACHAGRGTTEPAFGQRGDFPSHPPQASELITHVTTPDGQPQIVTVIDPRQRVMAVYHVERPTGEIALRSVRNFTWDLQMIEFNSGKPLPHDIRAAGSGAASRGRREHVVTDQ